MNKLETREQAESRALELFPIHKEFDVDRLKELRDAYLQGWDDAQQDKQTCGFCVEPATELTDEKHSESLDTKENEGSELPSEKQKELLCEMMRKDEASGMYELTKEVEMIECPDCNGEGAWYNDTSRECTTYRGDCCGGCGYYVDCDTCNGTGEIEKEEE
jgi:hypothetical protein